MRIILPLTASLAFVVSNGVGFSIAFSSVGNSLVPQHHQQQQPDDDGGGPPPLSKPRFQYTGNKRNIVWEDDFLPVTVAAEKALRQSGVLIRRGEFDRLTGDRVEEIAMICRRLNMTMAQAFSVRKQTMLTEMAFSSKVLKEKSEELSDRLSSGQQTILDLSYEYNQSPVSIMRAILSLRIHQRIRRVHGRHVKAIVKAIVNDELGHPHVDDFLNEYEQQQLLLAKASDVVGYVEQYDLSVHEAAMAWEDALYRFLDDQNISYLKEEELQRMGCKCTPDCLLLDDVTINNNKNGTAGPPVRWMDCKSYYGSANAKMFTRDLQKQINRYDEYFGGTGAVVYRHGYSAAMSDRVAPVVLLNRGPLKAYEVMDDEEEETRREKTATAVLPT